MVAGRRGKIGGRKRGENENEELIWGLLSREKEEKKIGKKNLVGISHASKKQIKRKKKNALCESTVIYICRYTVIYPCILVFSMIRNLYFSFNI